MSQKSKIEWTEATWNPTLGCSKKSPGCKNCYAIRVVHRLAGNPNTKISSANAGLTVIQNGAPNWTGIVRLIPERLDIPIRTRKPTTYFVNSLSDLFHESLSDQDIDQVFARMALCPQHTFQILTKTADRMHRYFSNIKLRQELIGIRAEQISGLDRHYDGPGTTPGYGVTWRFPLPNVHLGVSVEDQQRAEERIPWLLKTPAAVRWISAEPLLGRIDIEPFVCPNPYRRIPGGYAGDRPEMMRRLNWVVAGGESGPGARPMNPNWAGYLRDQCVSAGIAFHFKQNGSWSPLEPPSYRKMSAKRYSHETFAWDQNGNPYVSLRPPVGHFPTTMVYRVGKKAAGRLLDGRTWDERPTI